MSYKLGLLLSVAFMMAVLLLGTDLALLDAVENQVNAIAMIVGQRICYDGAVKNSTIQYVTDHQAKFIVVDGPDYGTAYGSTFVYKIEKQYSPIILSKSPVSVTVTRAVVVGFYRTTTAGRR
jgi:hypothetical protein